MRRHFFAVLLLMKISVGEAQQERKILFYNIGFGGLIGGIGALINKADGEAWEKQFFKGFWQGTIGGGLNFAAKKTMYSVSLHQNKIYCLPAFLLHSTGTSVIENAAFNNKLGETWKLEYGPVRIDYSIRKKEFRCRLLPMAFAATWLASRNSKLDLGTTLLTGRMVFQSNDSLVHYLHRVANGASFGRALTYGNQPQRYQLIAHEVIHQFQFSEFLVFNAWTKPSVSKIKFSGLGSLFKKYIYPDVPYEFLAYAIEGRHTFPNYYRNYFEFEAERLATNQYVPVR